MTMCQKRLQQACTRCSLCNGAYVKYPHIRYTPPPRYYRTSVKTHCDGALWSEPVIKSAAKPLVKRGKNSPNKARVRARERETERDRGEGREESERRRRYTYDVRPLRLPTHRHLSSPSAAVSSKYGPEEAWPPLFPRIPRNIDPSSPPRCPTDVALSTSILFSFKIARFAFNSFWFNVQHIIQHKWMFSFSQIRGNYDLLSGKRFTILKVIFF